MTTTTIKVSGDVRDRLKKQASAQHRTLGEHLAHLADLGDRQSRFAAMRSAINSSSAEDRTSYEDEVQEWERIDHG